MRSRDYEQVSTALTPPGTTLFPVDPKRLNNAIDDVLGALGSGTMDGVVYDTARLVPLAGLFPGLGFGSALTWLVEKQHDDGSWGSDILHYHDRVVSTLAAIIALRRMGTGPRNTQRIKRGVAFLWNASGKLIADAHDTGNFKGVVTMLTEEAITLGLAVPPFSYERHAVLKKKLEGLSRSAQNIAHFPPLVFSLEYLRLKGSDYVYFQEKNGSIGISPGTTAGYLLAGGEQDERALNYLLSVINADGSAPAFAPMDLFEIAWSVNHLRWARAVTPDHVCVKQWVGVLAEHWSPVYGNGLSTQSKVLDLDDTAATFNVLNWAGYPVDPNVFAHYKEAAHFRCFDYEADPSISAHLQLLIALRDADHPQKEEWIAVILKVLETYQRDHPLVWFDKWHYSPYYLARHVVQALRGFDDESVHSYLNWVANTQHPDGGWGYYGVSTPEETAYALQALIEYDLTYSINEISAVPRDTIDTGARWLSAHLHTTSFEPLWIGKCLYSTPIIIRSAILSALYAYQERYYGL